MEREERLLSRTVPLQLVVDKRNEELLGPAETSSAKFRNPYDLASALESMWVGLLQVRVRGHRQADLASDHRRAYYRTQR